MAKRTEDDILRELAAKIRQKSDFADWTEDLETDEGILKGQMGRLASLQKTAKELRKSVESTKGSSKNTEKAVDAEKKRIEQLKKDFKANNRNKALLDKEVATSRTLRETSAAKSDDLSQKIATLSAAGKDLKINDGGPLQQIIRDLAAGMATAVTSIRSLGLPAKEFTKKALGVLDKYKKGIEGDAALNLKGSPNAKLARSKILAILAKHRAAVTEAGELNPIKLLGKAMVGGIKQSIANKVKAIPGMGTMDKLAGAMGFKPISERINEKLGGKKGSLDQELARERKADDADVMGDVADTKDDVLGSRTNVDIGRASLDRAEAQDTAWAKRMGRRRHGGTGGDEYQKPQRETVAASSLGEFNEPNTAAPAGMGGRHGDDISALNDIIGILKTGINSLGLVPDILENTRVATWLLVGLAREDKERDIAWASERAEARQDANEDAAAGDTTPVPALDELSNSPIPAGASAGGGGGGGGKGGGIGGIIGNFMGGAAGGVIAGFMKAVGSVNPVLAGKFIIAITALGVGIGAFFVALAGAAKIIQMFGGGEAVQSLLTNVSAGLTAFNTIDGINLLAVGTGMITLGLGLTAITGGTIIAGLGSLLPLGDPLGDTARSLTAFDDVDGINLGKVGLGMSALAVGMAALTASNLISGIGNFISGAVGTVAGWFGAEEAEKEPGILGFVKQFEAIDAQKLNDSSQSIMKLAQALAVLSASRGDSVEGGEASPPSGVASSPPSGGGQQPTRRRRGRQRPPAPSGGVSADVPPQADSRAMPTGAPPAASTRGVMTPTKKMIMEHEGVRHTPYQDSLGLWTVGVGHLIGDGKTLPDSMNRTFSDDEVFTMFDGDYEHHAKAARKIPGYSKLGRPAQGALEDLTFNMGPSWYKEWPILTGQLSAGDTEGAARNLQGSLWYQQVKSGRGDKISGLIAADDGTSSMSPVMSSDRVSPFGDSEVQQSAGGNLAAGGTGSTNAAAQTAGVPGVSRSGAGVAAATASHASQTAAAPTVVANIGGPPAPAAPSVTTMMPIPIPINARTEDMALRALQSANYSL